jgi:serine/threonine protein kinase
MSSDSHPESLNPHRPPPDDPTRNLPDDPNKTWVPEDRQPNFSADTEESPGPPEETEAGSLGGSNAPGGTEAMDSAEAAEPPRQFGEYELLERVGSGGMGNVYKAHHRHLDRIVALKTMRTGSAKSERLVERFAREAKAAARLDHPHIVPCYEFGEQDGWHYLTMAFVAGESLQDRLKRGPLEPREAARMLQTLAGAVSYAHHQGVIHRDIKPGNVIIGEDGRARLTDFGIAKLTSPITTPLAPVQLTQVGQVLGTPGYMAPEQSAGRRWEVGPSADIYGLGGLLVAALTGQHPGSYDSIETLTQIIPVDLQNICDRCLAYRPQDRFATAHQLESALGHYLHGEDDRPAPTPSRIDLNAANREPTFTFKKKRVLQGTALLLLLVIAAIFLGPGVRSWWQGSSSVSPENPPAEEVADDPPGPRNTGLFPGPPGPNGTSDAPVRSRLEVRVDGGGLNEEYLPLDGPNTLPLHAEDKLLVDVKADHDAFLYLIRVDTQGKIHWENQGQAIALSPIPPPPPNRQAAPPAPGSREFNAKFDAEEMLEINREGPAGMLTLLLLSRKDPLLSGALDSVLNSIPAGPQPAPRDTAIQWFSYRRGRPVPPGELGPGRGTRNQLPPDHVVIMTMNLLAERLSKYSEQIEAISFAVPEQLP